MKIRIGYGLGTRTVTNEGEAFGRFVDDLERLGFARREPSSTDRRKRVVTPTPKGGRALAEAAEQLREAEERLLAPLTAKERRQLGTLVGKLFTPELLRC